MVIVQNSNVLDNNTFSPFNPYALTLCLITPKDRRALAVKSNMIGTDRDSVGEKVNLRLKFCILDDLKSVHKNLPVINIEVISESIVLKENRRWKAAVPRSTTAVDPPRSLVSTDHA